MVSNRSGLDSGGTALVSTLEFHIGGIIALLRLFPSRAGAADRVLAQSRCYFIHLKSCLACKNRPHVSRPGPRTDVSRPLIFNGCTQSLCSLPSRAQGVFFLFVLFNDGRRFQRGSSPPCQSRSGDSVLQFTLLQNHKHCCVR